MTAAIKKYRLVTRSDFDGLICAVLLSHLDMIDEIKFVHAKDMQEGTVTLSERDVTANLPYVPGVYLAFDHHVSESLRSGGKSPNHVIHPRAPSSARVVYDYYGGKKAFPSTWDAMLAAVDKSDMAQFSREEILRPQQWNLLNFIMDARTGLGRFHHFRISNYQLMLELVSYCRNSSIDDILQLPDVQERIQLYGEHELAFRAQLQRCAVLHNNLVVLDLRHEDTIYAGNRFVLYTLYPAANSSLQIMWGLRKQNTVLALGKSIFNRTADINIGELMVKHGGYGHENAGTCQIENEMADVVIQELMGKLAINGEAH
jgi:nanoRNase/pAp phosphatase (c-di-AMP/oligoRNAs hydrolase)